MPETIAVLSMPSSTPKRHVIWRICENDLAGVELLVLSEVCELPLDLPVFHYDLAVPVFQLLVGPNDQFLVVLD